MTHKILIAGAAAAAILAGIPVLPASAQQMRNNCAPEDKIDASTMAQAKQKLEAAGYTQIHDLRKGCDNYWHAEAMKGGQTAFVALSPQGQALPEGD
jgi:peptidase YpeB-like protein